MGGTSLQTTGTSDHAVCLWRLSQIAAEPPNAAAEFLIAVVGPLTSFALAAPFYFLEPSFARITAVFAIAKYLALINGTRTVQPHSGIHPRWGPGVSSHRLGSEHCRPTRYRRGDSQEPRYEYSCQIAGQGSDACRHDWVEARHHLALIPQKSDRGHRLTGVSIQFKLP